MSGDNIGVIALAVKDLDGNIAKKANLTGIVFACFITLIINIKWLPIKLVGRLTQEI